MDQSTQVFPPHLKKVLKSYQAAATTSLQGPNSFMGVWEDKMGASKTEKKTKCTDYDPFVAPPPIPIQQPPIFTPADQSRCERSETILESEVISCFVVGGEKRLCLPQILNTVLRDFSLQQINSVCDELHIFCSRCNTEQLEVLKVAGILPLSAPSCGLITKTDAERLCSALLHSNPPKSNLEVEDKLLFHLKVYHECFGKTSGIFWPDLYISPTSCCVECNDCKGLFTPQTFVCHTHRAKNRTCHWGFDSDNWRFYLLLSKEKERFEQCQQHLEEVKRRFDCLKHKRKQNTEDVDTTKRFRMEENPYSVLWDPTLAYWYAHWARMCGIKSWPHTKEGKSIFVPTNLPSYLRDSVLFFFCSLSVPVPSYIAHDASFPLDAEIMSDINRHYPSTVNSFIKRGKESSHTVTKNTDLILPKDIKTEPWVQQQEKQDEIHNEEFLDSDDTMSDTTLSTLSGTEAGGDSTDDEELETVLDNDLTDLKQLLEESYIDTGVCEKILNQVKLLILKNKKSLHNALHSKKLAQKELEKIRLAKRVKFHKIREDKKILNKQINTLKHEYEERFQGIENTKELIKWEDYSSKSEQTNKQKEDYTQLLNQNKNLQNQVLYLQQEIEKMKSYVTKSATDLEQNDDDKSHPENAILPTPSVETKQTVISSE